MVWFNLSPMKFSSLLTLPIPNALSEDQERSALSPNFKINGLSILKMSYVQPQQENMQESFVLSALLSPSSIIETLFHCISITCFEDSF